MSQIEHDISGNCFFVKLGSEKAKISYKLTPGLMEINSTFVPESGRGQGLAKKLTIAALEYARSNDLKVKPTCSYVVKFFESPSDYSNLLL